MLPNGFRRAGLLSLPVILGGALAAPAASAATLPPSTPCFQETADAGSPFQPLEVCASFDRTAYKSSQPITATVTVTNLGTATATNVSLDPFDDSRTTFAVPDGLFPGLSVDPFNGTDIPPGATVTGTAVGFATQPDSGFVEWAATVTQLIDGRQPASPEFDISAKVTPVSGNYEGKVVTSTTDVDGHPEPAQGLPGVTVTFSSPLPGGLTVQAVTDANGDFSVKDLPGGQYFLDFAAPGGWLIMSAEADIAMPGAPNHGRFAARRPESEILQASISFDQASYAVGDTAGMTLTFDNLTNVPLTGVRGLCNLSGASGSFTGRGEGWAPFDTTDGATVPPGESTFHVSETVPEPVVFQGLPVTDSVQCAFGNAPDFVGEPTPRATVAVTGF